MLQTDVIFGRSAPCSIVGLNPQGGFGAVEALRDYFYPSARPGRITDQRGDPAFRRFRHPGRWRDDRNRRMGFARAGLPDQRRTARLLRSPRLCFGGSGDERGREEFETPGLGTALPGGVTRYRR